MRIRQLLAALSAATMLAALLIGVPALLVAGLGNPLPDWDALRTGNLDDPVVLHLLGCVLWIAWAQWVPGTLLELAAGARDLRVQRTGNLHQIAREPRHVSAGQGLSRALVTTIISLVIATPVTASVATWTAPVAAATAATPPATTTAMPTSVAWPLAASPPPAASSGQGAHALAVDGHRYTHPTYVVGSDPAIGPSLWSIAEHTLGNPLRWREILALNRGHIMADGQTFTNPDLIHDGWRLRLPADAVIPTAHVPRPGAEVTVHPGDTLDAIARGEMHSDPQRVIETNLGRAEPAGRTFDDPNLILPGWTLSVPWPPDPATPSTTSHDPGEHRRPDPPRQHAPGPGRDPAPPPDPRPTRPPAPSTPDRSAPHTVGTDHDPVSTSTPTRPSIDVPMVAFAGGGWLLAGISLTALLAYRRRQFRNRRPGRTIPASPPELRRAERTLRGAGETAALDVTWLDHALRGLANHVHDGDGRAAAAVPDVVAVRLGYDDLELVLAAPSPDPPKPWHIDDTGLHWTIGRDDDTGYDPERRAYRLAPFPALVSIGHGPDGSQWLLDLERAGSISLTGDSERCLDLARFIACELAHNPWSEALYVTLAGFGQEVIDANPDRLSYADSYDSPVADITKQTESVNAIACGGGTDVMTARTTESTGDIWAPHVLLIAPTAGGDHDDLDRLLATLRDQPSRTAVAVMLAGQAYGPEHARCEITIDNTGTLRMSALDMTLTAHQLPADEAAEIAKLLATAATDTDAPMPPSADGQPWDRYADAAGGLRPTIDGPADEADGGEPGDAQARPAEPSGTLGVDGYGAASVTAALGTGSSVLPLPRETYRARAATTDEDINALAPGASDTIRQGVDAAVGDLDADLAQWYDDTCVRPRVSLLGPVRVRAQGDLPERNPRVAWHSEIVAYLATHPSGVSPDEYGTALWPNEDDIAGKSKVRQSAMIVRKWLGTNPDTGAEYLPPALTPGFTRYRIDGALIDAELFRRLRLRGVARGDDGIDDLWAALNLVTGVPFSQRRKGGYAWLVDNPLDHIYAAMIVDVAHTVATHHLGAGEPDRAAKAAQIALDAGSTEDVPLLDLVAAHDARDQRAEADALVKRILTNHDAEIEEDLPPRTAQVLLRRERIDNAS